MQKKCFGSSSFVHHCRNYVAFHILVTVITIIIAASLSPLITAYFLSCNHCLRPHLRQLSFRSNHSNSYQVLFVNPPLINYVQRPMSPPRAPRVRPQSCSCCGAPRKNKEGCSCTGGNSHVCLKTHKPMRQVLYAWQRVIREVEAAPSAITTTTTTTTTTTVTSVTVTATSA